LPAQFDDPKDKCDMHSRESFHDLTTLLGLTLYVDFPDNPADCHSKDPQNAHPSKAEAVSPLERLVALLTGNLVEVQGASAAGDPRSIADYRLAAMYFFSLSALDCASPHIILNPTP